MIYRNFVFRLSFTLSRPSVHPDGRNVGDPALGPWRDHQLPVPDVPQHPGRPQVWTLTQFFSVTFLWKLIDLPGGQINDPSSGKHYSLPFLPATPSSASRTLEGLFELTQRPSRALDSPHTLLLELQRYKILPGTARSRNTVKNNWRKPCVFI